MRWKMALLAVIATGTLVAAVLLVANYGTANTGLRRLAALDAHRVPVADIAVSQDGATIVTCDSRDMRVWQGPKWTMDNEVLGDGGLSCGRLAFEKAGIVAAGGMRRKVSIVDIHAGAELASLNVASGALSAIAASGDGRVLATGEYDGTVTIWQTTTHDDMKRLGGSGSCAFDICFSSSGRLLSVGRDDGSIDVYDVESGLQMRSLKGHALPVTAVSISNDESLVASGDSGGTIIVWDLGTGAIKRSMKLEQGGVNYIGILPGERYLLASGGKVLGLIEVPGVIAVWMLPSGRLQGVRKAHAARITCGALTQDGRIFVSGSADGSVMVWDCSALVNKTGTRTSSP